MDGCLVGKSPTIETVKKLKIYTYINKRHINGQTVVQKARQNDSLK